MADEKTTPPPYLPFRTFKGYIDGLKASGIPAKIDRSILKSRSGTEQTMLLNALQYLGLIHIDGSPTNTLTKLVTASNEERPVLLGDLLRLRYPFLFSERFNLQSATPAMINDTFQADGGLTGDTIRKAVAFFLAAAQDAKVPVSPFLKVRAPRGTSSQKRRSRGGSTNGESLGNATPAAPLIPQPGTAPTKSIFQTLIDILDPEDMDEVEQAAVWTLIRYLKKRQSGT